MDSCKGIKGFLDDVLSIFKTSLKGVKNIELWSGQFNPIYLNKIARRTPAVLLSLLSIKEISSAPCGRHVVLEMACFILVGNATQASKELDKNLVILPFVESILAILDESEHWTLYQSPRDIEADNLYSATGVQVAVWAVKWEQTIQLGTTEESLSSLDDFLKAGIEWQKIMPENKALPLTMKQKKKV